MHQIRGNLGGDTLGRGRCLPRCLHKQLPNKHIDCHKTRHQSNSVRARNDARIALILNAFYGERALGVRTATHKLIYYWEKKAYEMFDLTKDPTEQKNLLFGDEANRPVDVTAKFNELKAEITRLQKHYQDDGKYAAPASRPKDDVDGPFNAYQPLGLKTVAEAIKAIRVK